MTDLKNFIETNKERFLEELFSLLRIPSVSSKAEHQPDMVKCAERWKELLLAAGCDKAEVHPTQGAPVVYAEKLLDKNAPTVLVYGHYDVMPVEPLELWKTPPFEPTIIDGKIYCRGANDDKGQAFMHAKAFEYLVKTNQLTCNVKFMIEGEEEVGSKNLYGFCEANKEKLKADVILVSDTSMIDSNTPAITVGLRGVLHAEIEAIGTERELHSGLFGGAIANPLIELCKLIAGMTDENGKVMIQGFYDDVRDVPQKERFAISNTPFNEKQYKQAIGAKILIGESGFSTMERVGIRPSFEVTGIYGGHTGAGPKAVIPTKATAKVSMRIVPNQDYDKIGLLLTKYVNEHTPESMKFNVSIDHGGTYYLFSTDNFAYKAAEKAYQAVYNKTPILLYSGGTISIITEFEKTLGIKSLLMGFGLPSDMIHSPNENFSLENFVNGIKTIAQFYKFFAE
ncbi:MAG: dipeptidase [Bacteroidales bacterium]|jgi:acetylornithine deacetylase/succinyl-diaminopimelate desuccinylase-like protein|nr:dipeptidase [Bacteroidales bacterium]